MSLPQKCLGKNENTNRSNVAMRLSCDPMLHGIPPMTHTQMGPPQAMPRSASACAPPPIPPRPQPSQMSHYRNVGPVGVNSFYSTCGRYPLSHTYSGYNTYGSFGYGMPRYGYSHGYPPSMMGEMGDVESAFLRMAEESSRPAFQSIESLVTAVGSISMMLDSTYHAVYNSYRAVLGVVESFSRLRSHLAHVLSTLALLRTFQWLLQRLLYYLRLRKTDPSVEAAWSAATAVTSHSFTSDSSSPQSSWPILLFLSVVFGAPWLIFRIFSKLVMKKQMGKQAEIGEAAHAYALYEFRALHPNELSIKAGQHLTVAPKGQQPKGTSGWVLVAANKTSMGLVPANYIRIYRKKQMKPSKPLEETTNAELESAFEPLQPEVLPVAEPNEEGMPKDC